MKLSMNFLTKVSLFTNSERLRAVGTSRNILTSAELLSNWTSLKSRNENRQKRIFNKLLQGPKKKKWHTNAPNLAMLQGPKTTPFTNSEAKVFTPRRIYILNALFMEHITDVMSTGQIGSQLQGYGIEITKVKVSCDYMFLSVYWLIANCDSDRFDTVEKMLFSLSGEIRNLLSNLRLMGHIPKIIFVRDRAETYLAELQQRLAIADYGPSEESSDVDATNDTSVASEQNEEEEEKVFQDEINLGLLQPADMRQDIYGLDHRRMMNDVLRFRKKAEAAHRNPDCPYVFHEVPQSPAQTAAFTAPIPNETGVTEVKDFLRIRMREIARLKRQQKIVEREEHREEMERIRQEMIENISEEPDDEPDYYEEESPDFYKRDS